MFYGYCFTEDGWHTPAVRLEDASQVYRYLTLHGRSGMFKRVIATDEDDFCVAEIVDGKFIFPPEWERFNEEV